MLSHPYGLVISCLLGTDHDTMSTVSDRMLRLGCDRRWRCVVKEPEIFPCQGAVGSVGSRQRISRASWGLRLRSLVEQAINSYYSAYLEFVIGRVNLKEPIHSKYFVLGGAVRCC